MVSLLYTILIVLLVLLACIILFLFLKVIQLMIGRRRVSIELDGKRYESFPSPGFVKSLSILPVIDYYSSNRELKTEAGVSYLIKADDTSIMMDVGYNARREHPSALLHNMRVLGKNISDIDMIFISHIHLDHVGGMREQREKTFSLSQGSVDIGSIPVYAPGRLNPSRWNPDPLVEEIREPRIIMPGIASIGIIQRFLFMAGYIEEQSLAINVKGKGVVLIIGCGHQTIERIIERTRMLFTEPIYAIIGGLHLPVNGGRIMIGPLNLQGIVGSDRTPFRGVNEKDVARAIEVIKREDVRLVSLSPHDSSDWSIDRFKDAFKERYIHLRIGEEIGI
ncbi:MAG: MBL fold metallo-hydrolase [Spirochaetota bacterium]|nr:MBL fold metallo-hydrolase [Spirochaetota bacterium]